MPNAESSNPQSGAAVIYIRVSTDRQVHGASLETQERDCRLMCDRNEWTVIRLFREEGESAKSADRPQRRRRQGLGSCGVEVLVSGGMVYTPSSA